MNKLYSLAGAAGGSFACYGARFGVRVNDVLLLNDLGRVLPPCTRSSPGLHVGRVYSFLSPPRHENPKVRRFHLLYENAQLIKRGKQFSDLLDAFENAVSFHISQQATPYIFIHAGAVVWKGAAIVIPGASQSGKSTLVSAFLRAGATFLSDEFAVFDAAGKVHPYPRSISLRTNSNRKTKIAPECFGATTATDSVQLGMVVATHFRESSQWKPQRLSNGEAVLALLANGMSSQQRPERNMRILSTAIQRSVSIRGIRGEADQTAKSILHELQNGPQTVRLDLIEEASRRDQRRTQLDTNPGGQFSGSADE